MTPSRLQNKKQASVTTQHSNNKKTGKEQKLKKEQISEKQKEQKEQLQTNWQ